MREQDIREPGLKDIARQAERTRLTPTGGAGGAETLRLPQSLLG